MDNTGALLEQVRKLERGLSGPAWEETGEAGASPQPLPLQDRLEERTAQPVERGQSASGEPGGKNAGSASETIDDLLGRSPKGAFRNTETVEQAGQASISSTKNVRPGQTFAALEKDVRPEQTFAASEENAQLGQVSSAWEEKELPGQITDVSEEKERAGEGAVLLGQLKRLEQAAAFGAAAIAEERYADRSDSGKGPAAGAVLERRRGAYPDIAGAAGESWALGRGFAGPGPTPAEEIQRAERTDKIFRRDSRRYDGGFYLY